MGVGFVRDADITARALEIIDERLPKALVYEWIATAREVLIEVVGEEDNARAEELLRAFVYDGVEAATSVPQKTFDASTERYSARQIPPKHANCTFLRSSRPRVP